MWFCFGHCHSMCKWSIKNGIFPLWKKCPYSEFFWSTFSRVFFWSAFYRVNLRIHSKCGKNAEHKTFQYGHFSCSVPNSLKCANVIPICKREDPFGKKNYRPVSILPLLSKVYGRVIYEQASNYFEPFFLMKFCVDSEKHIVHFMLYFTY